MAFNQEIKQLTTQTKNHASVFNEVNNQLLDNTKHNKEQHDLLQQQVDDLEESTQTIEWENVTNKPTEYEPVTHEHAIADIINFPTSMPANGGNADTVDGKHATEFAESSHRHDVSEIDGIEGGGVTWNDIEGKPSTYPPSSHSHDATYHKVGATEVRFGNDDYLGHDDSANRFYTRSDNTGTKNYLYGTSNKPTKADVGLSAVNNWGATSSPTHGGTTVYATAAAVKQAYDRATGALSTSVIKKIQRGVTLLNVAGGIVNVTISSVNTAKTMVNLAGYTTHSSSNNGPLQCVPKITLVNSTTLELSKYITSTGYPTYISWEVIEFN